MAILLAGLAASRIAVVASLHFFPEFDVIESFVLSASSDDGYGYVSVQDFPMETPATNNTLLYSISIML